MWARWLALPTLVSELEDAVDETAGTDRWLSTGPGTLAACRSGIPRIREGGRILVHAVEEGKVEAVRGLLVAGAR